MVCISTMSLTNISWTTIVQRMPIPFSLDHTIERVRATDPVPSLVRRLTGLHVPVDQSRSVLASILEHKWLLSERLGRDVGLRVAAVDYVENMQARAV